MNCYHFQVHAILRPVPHWSDGGAVVLLRQLGQSGERQNLHVDNAQQPQHDLQLLLRSDRHHAVVHSSFPAAILPHDRAAEEGHRRS